MDILKGLEKLKNRKKLIAKGTLRIFEGYEYRTNKEPDIRLVFQFGSDDEIEYYCINRQEEEVKKLSGEKYYILLLYRRYLGI